MPIIVACPSCGDKLRVAEALCGQRVRCPACNHVFDSTAEPGPPAAAPRAPQDLPLDLTIDEPSSPQPAPSIGTSGLLGAIELTPSSDEPPPPPEPPRRPRLADEQLDRDTPDLRRLGPRRDAEPDRGPVVLSLGIISLALILVWCAAPVGAILGLAAWIMGRIDLRKMKSGQMDDHNRGMTQAGWICGILGTLLNSLMMLGCGLFIGAIWYSEMSRPPNTRPIPATRPAPLPPRKGIIVQPAAPDPPPPLPRKGAIPRPNPPDPPGKKF